MRNGAQTVDLSSYKKDLAESLHFVPELRFTFFFSLTVKMPWQSVYWVDDGYLR